MIKVDSKQISGLMSWAKRRAGKNFETKPDSNPYYVVSSLVIVGALLAEGSSDGLSDSDQMHFIGSIAEMIRCGIQFSDTLDVKICNLAYEHDFLADTPDADCLLFAWVNKDLSKICDINIGGESDLLDKGQTWKMAIKQAGARIVTFSTDFCTCVDGGDIPATKYMHLNPADEETLSNCPVYMKIPVGYRS